MVELAWHYWGFCGHSLAAAVIGLPWAPSKQFLINRQDFPNVIPKRHSPLASGRFQRFSEFYLSARLLRSAWKTVLSSKAHLQLNFPESRRRNHQSQSHCRRHEPRPSFSSTGWPRSFTPFRRAGKNSVRPGVRFQWKDAIPGAALPPRDNSVVDGYALGPAVTTNSFLVRARTAAGQPAHPAELEPGKAVRIFTGTAAVVMQEDVLCQGRAITVCDPLQRGQNIRRGGEDVRAGNLLVAAGTRLDPRHVAILAAAGLSKIPLTRPVRVALFSTGRELCEPGTALGPASIHDSNRWMLGSLLRGSTVEVRDIGILPDQRHAISQAIDEAAKEADLVLSTGGVSVGEEDHFLAALARTGADPTQRRMAVKPGKPFVFGKIGRAIALGLSGKPCGGSGLVPANRATLSGGSFWLPNSSSQGKQ